MAFALGSSADLICAVLGAARVGLIPVLLNATLTAAERDRLADDAEPALRIFDPGGPGRADRRRRAAPAELAPYPLTRPMHYTSGTTGRPKGVTTGLWDEATARAVFEDEAAVWHFDPADLHMVCSPMYHTVSIRFSTGTLLPGGSLAILSRFDAATALDVLRRHRPTTAFLVPTHLQRILQLPRPRGRRALRLAPPAGPRRRAVPRVGQAGDDGAGPPGAVWEFYGSTEAQFTVCSPDEWLEHPGTVGRARPGRRLFVDPLDDGERRPTVPMRRRRPLDADGSGTIWCDHARLRPLQLLAQRGGHRQAWRGAACTVGDLGRLTADGYLFLTGRRHDLIISGGVNVYPAEVENVLAAVAGVEEVAVFGLPDEQWGQRSASPTWPTSTRAPRRPCGPPPRPTWPRTSGPSRTSPPRTCPTRPPAS